MRAKQEYRVITFLRQNRFGLLLLGLFVLFFHGAVIDVFAPRLHSFLLRIAVGAVLMYMMAIATFIVGSASRSSRLVVFLAIPAILFEALDLWLLHDWTQILSHAFGILFLSYVVIKLLGLVFASRRVTADTIFASLCAYLLLATLWMYGYSLLELFDPGAFSYPQMQDRLAQMQTLPSEMEGEPIRIMRLGRDPAGIEFYFSVVTMTTLGYGDIVPISPASRSMATLQAVVGQLYLAVLVARLVGLHVAEAARNEK